MARRVEFTVSEETWQRIENARGDVPRAAWIKRKIETDLEAKLAAEAHKEARIRKIEDSVLNALMPPGRRRPVLDLSIMTGWTREQVKIALRALRQRGDVTRHPPEFSSGPELWERVQRY